jgi:hypothetical protein
MEQSMETTLSRPDRLPDELLDRVWQKLLVSYGHLFKAQWDGLPISAVREDWAEELASFAGKPWAIDYALAHRPDRLPLTAAMFRRLCSQAIDPAQTSAQRDPGPRANPQRVAEVVGRCAVGSGRSRHPRQWAVDLRNRELAGQRLGLGQRKLWREALGYSPDVSIQVVADSLAA